jgi:hypothetical protein
MSLLSQKRDMVIRYAPLSVSAIASLGAVFTAVISRSLACARQAISPLAVHRVRPVLAGVRRTAGHRADHALMDYSVETLDHTSADTAMMGPEHELPRCKHPVLISGPATAPASPGSCHWPWSKASDSMCAWSTTWSVTRRVADPQQGKSLGHQYLRTAVVLPGN